MEQGGQVMIFPKAPRVVYRKNPLSAVECSFGFPGILEIGTKPAAEFQARIRDSYPTLEVLKRGMPDVTEGAPPEVLELLERLSSDIPPTYRFETEDATRWVMLSDSRISLRETRYQRREVFLAEAERIERAFREVYNPAAYTRTGIRYSNVIVREELGLAGVPWERLLKPELLGLLAGSVAFTERIREVRGEVDFDLGPQSRCRVRHGLVREGESPGSPSAYVLDFDFFKKPRKGVKKDAFKSIREFSNEAGNLFKALITEELHEALEPVQTTDE